MTDDATCRVCGEAIFYLPPLDRWYHYVTPKPENSHPPGPARERR